jgi:quercetin dioxygenase-like cupin family protein
MEQNKIVKVPLDGGKKLNITFPIGAQVSMLMDAQTVGTRYLTENVTRVAPGLTLQPCHSHKDIEEIVYVVAGEGEIWIDGDTCKIKSGDSVLYPPNSRHTVKNTGSETLVLLCFFSSPSYRKDGAYSTHQEVNF